MEEKNELLKYIQNISLFLLGIIFMAFPVIFAINVTDPFVLPKQVLLASGVIVLLILQAAKMLSEKSVKLRRTPFDIPVLLLAVVAFLSSLFSGNRIDSLIAFVPYFFVILAFFLIVNIAKDKNSLLFLMFSTIIGALLLSVLAILSFFKIYILPLASTHTQTFNPMGSLLDQGIYLTSIFMIAFYYLYRLIRSKGIGTKQEGLDASVQESKKLSSSEMIKAVGFGAASFVILLGTIVTVYSLFKIEKPLILPFETGFQTAFSEISLDSGRIAQGFLLGSGYGTYAVDFSRWKQATFNQNADLWNLIFFRSSSLVLELLATTGVLGLCAFIFLLIRGITEMRSSPQNKILLSLLAFFVISFLLPIGFINQALFFIVLGLFAANQGLITKTHNRFFDIELQLVAFKKGLIAMESPNTRNEKSLILPSVVSVFLLAMVGTIGYFSVLYAVSDLTFQKSLVAAAQNNGSLTYEQQAKAIELFPYRDGFYRVFSQTNLALANSLASQQPSGQAPNPAVQQNITTLIQQSINSARNATTLAPLTYANWQNLSSIYRALIGFGQNAEAFAVTTAQQSASLDPNNPIQYIASGGIYYQLAQWDNAQNQFQIAIALKPDYANSHYNLGHALEQKGELQNALAQYEIVKTLVTNDKVSLDQITKEVEALKTRIASGSETALTGSESQQEQALNINTPAAQLPPQNPPVEIPAPNEPTPTPTEEPAR